MLLRSYLKAYTISNYLYLKYLFLFLFFNLKSLGVYWVDSGTLPLSNLTVEFQSSKKYMDDVTGRIFKVYPNDNEEVWYAFKMSKLSI